MSSLLIILWNYRHLLAKDTSQDLSESFPNLNSLFLYITQHDDLTHLALPPLSNLYLELSGDPLVRHPRLPTTVEDSLVELTLLGVRWEEAKRIMNRCSNLNILRCLHNPSTLQSVLNGQENNDFVTPKYPAGLLDLVVETPWPEDEGGTSSFSNRDLLTLTNSSCCERLKLLAVSSGALVATNAFDDAVFMRCVTRLAALEVLVLDAGDHPSATGRLELGLTSVIALFRSCPRLSVLGDLRAWTNIDYFNPNSVAYRRRDGSKYDQLVNGVRSRNWDINLDAKFSDLKSDWEK